MMVALPDVNEPVTLMLPLMMSEDDEVTEPLTVKLSRMIPVPVMVLEAPLIVSVLPVACVNAPGLVVERSPLTVIFEVAEMAVAAITRL